MRCPRCQHENAADAAFCDECGARLETVCSGCGESNRSGAKFCRKCGQAISAAAPSISSRFDAPQAYTPKHLAEKILTSKAALEGERKQVTVLFADLKGSMELLADRDPEEARKLLDPVLERMMEAVHRYEGTVNQVMGDGIMALFGAPVAHEDHAVRACYAALRMQESVKRYAEGVRHQEGISVRIRVGLNSGEVVVRAIGSDLHMDYTAVGQTTHLAARMEQLADPGATLLTPETLALAEGFVQVTSLGPMAVKGLAAHVEVYELTGISGVRSRLEAAAARGLSRFVGRDAEIKQLRRAVDQARQGRGQVAAVVGGPGVGKSRLIFELTNSRRFEGWLILQAGAVSYGQATSYLPVIDLLKSYFHIDERDSPHAIREKVTGRLLMLDRAFEATLPALLALLDVSGDDPQWQTLDPPQRRQRTLDAVKRLLLREAQAQPLLVVFEDLHWVDSETQAVLDGLVESLPSARLLLLVNYRPEYEHRWVNKSSYTQVRLNPLPAGSAAELLHELLGDDTSVAPLVPILIERTQGNPFFVEECVRMLVETTVLVGERGAFRMVRPLASMDVPPTVQTILAARIDRLPADDKRLLEAAAVIGKTVSLPLLAAVADTDEPDVMVGLGRLQTREFLYETGLFPDLEYTFKHALTHEVAYLSLLRERRRALHARIVYATEELYSESLGEHVERLAHHALHAELWKKAATYATRAGTRATELSAAAAGKTHFEAALEALSHLPERRETIAQAVELRCLLSGPYYALADREGYLRVMEDALGAAERLGEPAPLARVLGIRTNALWSAAEYTRARESGERALTLAQACGDRPLLVHANLNLGMVCHSVGEYERAAVLYARTAELLCGDLERERLGRFLYPSVFSRSELASVHSDLGRFDSALAILRQALELADSLGHRATVLRARIEYGNVLSGRGNFDAAIPALQAAREAAREPDVVAWAITSSGLLGYTLAMAGRLAEGIPLLREALGQAAGSRQSAEASFAAHLGHALLRESNVEEALQLAERALSLSRQRGERATEARSLYLLGEVEAQGASPRTGEQAERRYAEGLALASELGMRPLVAHCHLGLGKLYRRTGKREQAHEHLTTATTMYREMDMRFWLEQGEAEIGALG
jgi:class 3 adenylate cyclase/tetratricopeptide (TPR) repeat protein